MNTEETTAFDPNLVPDPPEGSSLTFTTRGPTQIVTAEGAAAGIWRLGLASVVVGACVVLALLAMYYFSLGTMRESALLWCIGISALFLAYAYIFVRDHSLSQILQISNGFLEIEIHNLFGSSSSIVSLEKIVETTTGAQGDSRWMYVRKPSLYVRMPTCDFKPMRRFLRGKDYRRNNLLSYVILIASCKTDSEIDWIEAWLNLNIDAAKIEALA